MKVLHYYFFIGTVAELIKVFPIMMEFDKKNIDYMIIASGQNDITKSELLNFIKKRPEIILSNKKIHQSAVSLFLWFIKTTLKSISIIGKLTDKKNSIMVVHGDTVSTVMGAFLAKFFGMKVAHIEAGLRSFNFLHPFPEEIDRVLVSHMADVHFCPNEWAMKNIKNGGGVKVNTENNTLIDSLAIALDQKIDSELIKSIKNNKYFIFILHRQENLMNRELVQNLTEKLSEITKETHCVFVLHEPTRKVLSDMDLLKDLEKNKKITLLSRLSYVEFMHVLSNSEYIITDGGSNQEESYFMGKPCLILRKKTERIEGLGHNVLLSNLDSDTISKFIVEYKSYLKPKVQSNISPSSVICNALAQI